MSGNKQYKDIVRACVRDVPIFPEKSKVTTQSQDADLTNLVFPFFGMAG